MTHTIYRGRTRAGPDPVMHLQISQRRERERELQSLSHPPAGFDRMQLEPDSGGNPRVSPPREPVMQFDEVLQRTVQQKENYRVPGSPDAPPGQERKLPAFCLAALPADLAGRIPVIPFRQPLSLEDPAIAHEFEDRATARVKPTGNVTS